MKKKVLTVSLLCIGAGLWLVLANVARTSIKQWDAKFGTVLRHSLADLGVTDEKIQKSVHKIQKDADGEWVTYLMRVEVPSEKMVDQVQAALAKSGGQISRLKTSKETVLRVERGGRLYQEIEFKILPPS